MTIYSIQVFTTKFLYANRTRCSKSRESMLGHRHSYLGIPPHSQREQLVWVCKAVYDPDRYYAYYGEIVSNYPAAGQAFEATQSLSMYLRQRYCCSNYGNRQKGHCEGARKITWSTLHIILFPIIRKASMKINASRLACLASSLWWSKGHWLEVQWSILYHGTCITRNVPYEA